MVSWFVYFYSGEEQKEMDCINDGCKHHNTLDWLCTSFVVFFFEINIPERICAAGNVKIEWILDDENSRHLIMRNKIDSLFCVSGTL
jgi:hypothetical protein